MQVYIRYSFTDDKNSLFEQVNEFFASLDMESEVQEDRVFAEKEYKNWAEDEPVENYFLRQAVDDCKKLFEVLKRGFAITGVIDTSFSAGECADFALTCKGGQITAQLSDWYIETCMEDYDNYEDFCDSFYECTQEEYDAIKNCEFVYLVESPDGDYLTDCVPLHDIQI